MTNDSGHPRIEGSTEAADLLNAPRPLNPEPITSGLDFVQRWEARALFTGLLSGDRAHRILLELVRRIAADAPPDQAEAFARLYELQQFFNAMGASALGAPEIPIPAMLDLLDEIRSTLTSHRDKSPTLIQESLPTPPARILISVPTRTKR